MVQVTSQMSRVYSELHDAILRLEAKPGEPLTERQLERQFGVSRTPIREALHQLEQDGLVQRQVTGYRVAPINVKEMLDWYELRILIERECVQHLAGRVLSDAEMAAAEDILGNIDDHLSPWQKISFTRDFHLLLARLSGNEVFPATLEKLLQHIYRARYLEAVSPKDCKNEHRIIWEQICAGNKDLATAVLERHIERSKRRMTARITQYLTTSDIGLVSTE